MKTKKDISAMLARFTWTTAYDEELQKHFIIFEDRKRGGHWMLMLKGEQWSIHGRGYAYCDDGETFLSEKEVVDFIWANRSAFRQTLKDQEGMMDEVQRNT